MAPTGLTCSLLCAVWLCGSFLASSSQDPEPQVVPDVQTGDLLSSLSEYDGWMRAEVDEN